jgi:1-acyl-sn-glycerol-3-phosphate acyltransferase
MFTKLWTFWCLCTFILFASIFYIVEFVLIALGNLTYVWAHRWPAFCARIIVSSWGIRIRQHNKELLQNLPQCVIVINHRSDLDAMIATGYMPGIFKFIGKKELERYPFIGQLVRQLYITVDRSNNVSKHQSVNNMKKQSNKGANIVVFPEGWSNFSNEYLLEFKRGAFKVALDGQLPVVVCAMIGTHELFPKPKISLRPGTADVYWETIIDTQHLTFEKDSDALQQQVADIFLARLKQAYPNGYHYPADQMDFKTWQAKQLGRK